MLEFRMILTSGRRCANYTHLCVKIKTVPLKRAHNQNSKNQRPVFELMDSFAVPKTESAYVVHPLIPRALNYVRNNE